MTQCTEITATRANKYPPLMPRKQASEVDRLESDISQDVDCAGAGVTITQSVWSLDAGNADTGLVLGADFVAGLVAYCPISGGTDGVSYLVHNDITTSDGLELRFSFQVPIMETVRIAFSG